MKPKKPTIGAVTKKQVMKQTSKVKPPMTAAGVAAKKKSRLKTAGALAGVVGTAVGSVLADARFSRGADRVRGGNLNIKVSPKDAWKAGKNKKSTKK
jgi:hypothetical protein